MKGKCVCVCVYWCDAGQQQIKGVKISMDET